MRKDRTFVIWVPLAFVFLEFYNFLHFAKLLVNSTFIFLHIQAMHDILYHRNHIDNVSFYFYFCSSCRCVNFMDCIVLQLHSNCFSWVFP